MIYYAILPRFSSIVRYVKAGNFDSVYDKVLFITGDPEEAIEASSWCELAVIGEVYQHEQFTIKIIEDDN